MTPGTARKLLAISLVLITIIIAFAVIGGAFAQSRAVEIHYAPEENLERIDTGLIGSARATIDMTAYVLTDVAVIRALAAAGRRGVRVRIFRDRSRFNTGKTVAGAIEDLRKTPNVEIRFTPRRPFMHLKSYSVDGGLLRTGSANFSASGLKNQENDLLVVREPSVVKRFQTLFEKLWKAR